MRWASAARHECRGCEPWLEEEQPVSETSNRRAVDRLLEGLNARNLELFHAQFHEDSVMEYPQSGERIVGGANRRGVYGAFPGLPRVDPTRVREQGDLVVVEARLDYGDGADWRGVFVFELRDGLVSSETAYFTQPFEPAAWRAPWVQPARSSPRPGSDGEEDDRG
jgi:hypothetical protein